MKIKEKTKEQGFSDARLRGKVREVGRSAVPLVATHTHSGVLNVLSPQVKVEIQLVLCSGAYCFI